MSDNIKYKKSDFLVEMSDNIASFFNTQVKASERKKEYTEEEVNEAIEYLKNEDMPPSDIIKGDEYRALLLEHYYDVKPAPSLFEDIRYKVLLYLITDMKKAKVSLSALGQGQTEEEIHKMYSALSTAVKIEILPNLKTGKVEKDRKLIKVDLLPVVFAKILKGLIFDTEEHLFDLEKEEKEVNEKINNASEMLRDHKNKLKEKTKRIRDHDNKLKEKLKENNKRKYEIENKLKEKKTRLEQLKQEKERLTKLELQTRELNLRRKDLNVEKGIFRMSIHLLKNRINPQEIHPQITIEKGIHKLIDYKPLEYLTTPALIYLLHKYSDNNKYPNRNDFLQGNAPSEKREKTIVINNKRVEIKESWIGLTFPNYELAQLVTGKKAPSGWDIERVDEALSELGSRKVYTEERIPYKTSEGEERVKLIYRTDSHFNFNKVYDLTLNEEIKLRGGDEALDKRKRLTTIKFNPILLQEIQSKYTQLPNDFIQQLRGALDNETQKFKPHLQLMVDFCLNELRFTKDKKGAVKGTFKRSEKLLLKALRLEKLRKSRRETYLIDSINFAIKARFLKSYSVENVKTTTKKGGSEKMYTFVKNMDYLKD